MFKKCYYLDWIIRAGKFDFFGDPADEGVVVRPDSEGRKIALRVAGRVDADVVAGNALVAFHLDDRLSDFATCNTLRSVLGNTSVELTIENEFQNIRLILYF